jgi:hypothetical protein
MPAAKSAPPQSQAHISYAPRRAVAWRWDNASINADEGVGTSKAP